MVGFNIAIGVGAGVRVSVFSAVRSETRVCWFHRCNSSIRFRIAYHEHAIRFARGKQSNISLLFGLTMPSILHNENDVFFFISRTLTARRTIRCAADGCQIAHVVQALHDGEHAERPGSSDLHVGFG